MTDPLPFEGPCAPPGAPISGSLLSSLIEVCGTLLDEIRRLDGEIERLQGECDEMRAELMRFNPVDWDPNYPEYDRVEAADRWARRFEDS